MLRACRSTDPGVRTRVLRNPCAKPPGSARGWVCAVSHDTVHSSAASAAASRSLPAAAQLIVSWGAGPPSPAAISSTCMGQTPAAASDGAPVCKSAPAVKEDGPLPAHVPVFDDVFVLGGGNHKNFYWFEADTGVRAGVVQAMHRLWCCADPHHFRGSTTSSWLCCRV
jgi:hypothetical protein